MTRAATTTIIPAWTGNHFDLLIYLPMRMAIGAKMMSASDPVTAITRHRVSSQYYRANKPTIRF
jgi:hypothetical protein